MTMQQLMMGGGGSNRLVGTFDPSNKNANVILSNGNLTMSAPVNAYCSVLSTTSLASGQNYVELTWDYNNGAGFLGVGNASSNVNSYAGSDGNSLCWNFGVGNIIYNGGSAGYAGISPPAVGGTVGMKIDRTNGTIAWNVDGGTFSASFGLPSGAMFIMPTAYNSGWTLHETPTYTIPTGYVYWGN